jgi:hypothetical protein
VYKLTWNKTLLVCVGTIPMTKGSHKHVAHRRGRLTIRKMLESYEIYEYVITHYDTRTGHGGMFVEYINTFLKLKAEFGPQNEQERYVRAFWENEEKQLDKDCIQYNAANGRLAKPCLNSTWGN